MKKNILLIGVGLIIIVGLLWFVSKTITFTCSRAESSCSLTTARFYQTTTQVMPLNTLHKADVIYSGSTTARTNPNIACYQVYLVTTPENIALTNCFRNGMLGHQYTDPINQFLSNPGQPSVNVTYETSINPEKHAVVLFIAGGLVLAGCLGLISTFLRWLTRPKYQIYPLSHI